MLFFNAGERRHLRNWGCQSRRKNFLKSISSLFLLVFQCSVWCFQIESLWFWPFPSSALFLQNVSKIEKNPTKRAGANLAPKGPEKDHEILAKQHLGHPMNGSSLIKMAPEDIFGPCCRWGLEKGMKEKRGSWLSALHLVVGWQHHHHQINLLRLPKGLTISEEGSCCQNQLKDSC